MFSPLMHVNKLKPGSAMYPIPGINYEILDIESNKVLNGNNVNGMLCIKPGWPGQARGVWNNPERIGNT